MPEKIKPASTVLASNGSRSNQLIARLAGAVSTRAANYITIGFLCFLTLYGGWLRVFHLGNQSLWLDEGISILHAKAILEHGYPILPNGRVSWDSFPVHYLMAIGFYALRDPHLAGRILSVLVGTASIPLIFCLCRSLFGSRLHGLLAALFLSFSMIEIAWSRQARLYPFLQFFVLASLLCGYRFFDTQRFRYLCGAAVFMILAILTHRSGYSAALFFIFLAAVSLPSIWRKLPSIRRSLAMHIGIAAGLVGIAAFVVLIVPSHSNLLDATKRIISSSPVNYSLAYISFLIQQLGLLFPMSILGMLIAVVAWPKKAIPLVATVIVYFLVIGNAWRYFAFRYCFPLFAPLLTFAAVSIAFPFTVCTSSRGSQLVRAVCCAVVLFASVSTATMVFAPRERYTLGFTAPQPEWKDAYDLIVEREKRLYRLGRAHQEPTTISAVPLFHDIYLGQKTGKKYYLPISFTGYPGDVAGADPYTAASVIRSLRDLLSINGYLLLDDFGLRMLVNKDIQHYLASKTPNAVLKHEYNIFIWVLEGTKTVESKRQEKTEQSAAHVQRSTGSND